MIEKKNFIYCEKEKLKQGTANVGEAAH